MKYSVCQLQLKSMCFLHWHGFASQMQVSVTSPPPSGLATDFGGDRLSAGFVVARRGEGCLITRGTFSQDWERVLKFSTGVVASRSGECTWNEAYWYWLRIGNDVVRSRWLLNTSSLIGRGPWWLREVRILWRLWKLWTLRFSSKSSRVDLNAFTTRSC